MPHDNNIFCELIPGILEGNRAHHVEIKTIALKQIKPFQIDMDDYPSFQHQQLLGVSPPAPWAVLNARTAGQIDDDDLDSARDVLRGSMPSTIAGIRIAPDRLIGETGKSFGRAVAEADHGAERHVQRRAKLAEKNGGRAAFAAFDSTYHSPADTRPRGELVQGETGVRPHSSESISDRPVQLLLAHSFLSRRSSTDRPSLSILPNEHDCVSA